MRDRCQEKNTADLEAVPVHRLLLYNNLTRCVYGPALHLSVVRGGREAHFIRPSQTCRRVSLATHRQGRTAEAPWSNPSCTVQSMVTLLHTALARVLVALLEPHGLGEPELL